MRLERNHELNVALAQSEAGKSLQSIYRWGQFRTTETDAEWIKVFGGTGRVDTHSELFYHLAEKFTDLEDGRFSPSQWETFLYGIKYHDIGEAKPKGIGQGDISAQVKTAVHEAIEEKMAHKMIRSLSLPPELKEKVQDGYKKVIEGEDKDLNFAFKALEKSEYVLTAMKVYQNCEKLNEQGLPSMNEDMEKALVGRVLVIDLPKVLDVYIPKFSDSLGRLFKSASPLIDEMFDYSLPWLQTHSEWMGKPVDHKALAETFKAKWEDFKNRTA